MFHSLFLIESFIYMNANELRKIWKQYKRTGTLSHMSTLEMEELNNILRMHTTVL